MATHLAAVSAAKGERFAVQTRPTPKPGPGELLIAVKSVAINPADVLLRAGFLPLTYPTVIGFDLAGLVLEVGDDVPSDAVDEDGQPLFLPGVTRIAAYAAFFWRLGKLDYGAFQERCLVPWQHAAPIPDALSWNQAATLPVSVQVPLAAWDIMGIPRLERGKKAGKKEALLIWGASSSVGTMGVQSARLLCEEQGSAFSAVYATAGAANHAYVSSLGAGRVFDYKDPHVVDAIVAAAKADGVIIRHCFLAMGDVALCQAVLKAFVATDEMKGQTGSIASAPPLPEHIKDVPNIKAIFFQPAAEEQERLAQYQYWFGTWLKEKLARKQVKPSPEPKVVGKGLDAINGALDIQGVSCAKLVVEIAE